MKKPIIIAFALIFILFGIGSGVTIFNLLATTANLQQLINLHEIEDIRQELSFSLQKIQNYTFSSPDFFAQHLDEIIDNAEIVNNTISRCDECHHEQAVQAELEQAGEMINEYQEQLSFLITTVAQNKHRRDLQLSVANQSSTILNKVQDMAARAATTLNIKTSRAMNEIDRSYIFLAATLVLTFLAALVVARILTGLITRPINELLTATNKIANGELGYQTDYKGNAEFESLIVTFNEMSDSLARKEMKIQDNLDKLSHLNLMTLPLHSAQDMSIIINYLRSGINTLLAADHVGILLLEKENEHFQLNLFDSGDKEKEVITIALPRKNVLDVYQQQNGQSILLNDINNDSWPFGDILPGNISLNNLLVVWIMNKNEVNGALVAINKQENGLIEEDLKIIGILANNMSVALENIRLYKNTQQQMIELKKTQRQLIEAEKLTALGTLAGGVAHDFNNILCGMIGYVALPKRNHDQDGKDFKMLETIEKAGFRAANLTKQLLTFSRQEALDHRPIELKPHVENVVKLLENTISKMITIRLDLAEKLPPVLSDPAQLEQVVMNLSVNARDAMPNGGEIFIQSEKVTVDEQFCETYPEAKSGEYIRLTVADKGEGIDQEILPRIFEPFFTTKEFGKGTGLGLAMVYGIVKSHKGFCIVSSSPGKGSSFAVYLPVAGTAEDEEEMEHTADQLMKANVLIVDDEELVVSMLAEHLQNLGCHTFLAGNGEEALEILTQNLEELDVVILDINMPVMDGKAAYEKMVEIKPELKVLVASGYSLNGQAEELLQKGAHGFIQKPYSLENIAAKIRQVLS
jgi:signal transduction histidine kinase/ActR/RegA family two-component response regulator/HAMP domain-containing protein